MTATTTPVTAAGLSEEVRRVIRTFAQFLVSGGLTGIIQHFFGGVDPGLLVLIQGINMLVVTYAQNWLEENTSFPAFLKAPASGGVNPLPDPTNEEIGGTDVESAAALAAAQVEAQQIVAAKNDYQPINVGVPGVAVTPEVVAAPDPAPAEVPADAPADSAAPEGK